MSILRFLKARFRPQTELLVCSFFREKCAAETLARHSVFETNNASGRSNQENGSVTSGADPLFHYLHSFWIMQELSFSQHFNQVHS